MVLPESHRLEILHQLGSGSFGTVYAAWDKERQRTVALKILHPHFDPHSLRRFKAEFRALADIAHPNLVTLYDLICDDERWLLTMELLDGTTFRNWIRPDDVCQMLRLREGLRQLGNGLNALHDSGILHRDIKPSNVLVTEDGRLVLIDFGMAVETDAAGAHRSRNVMGTPHYMAPEQATGQAVTAASDWYSVGVLMYECMTGELPYRGSLFEVLTAKVNPPSEEVLAALTGCPGDLAQLCKDLIRLEPATRPSGNEVMKRLGNTLNMLPSSVPVLPRLIGREASHLPGAA
ncbi:MAG: serine/threonine-protein kinase [Candidatus Xenobia bacterium]